MRGLHRAELPVEREAATLAGATGWLNTGPLTLADLRGRVVLVSFWTYSCINWIRTLPYLGAWSDKYAGDGLLVLGVHTPEFAFETDVDNVREAARAMHVDYPIALDSNYAVWQAFDNHYWPALYFVDERGRVRHHHFGEGEYERSEMVLQRLLAEAGAPEVADDLVTVQPQGLAVAADWQRLRSPETYLGYDRAERFASPEGAARNVATRYSQPASGLTLNQWALTGDWTIGREAAAAVGVDGRIVYRFHARDVNLVMGPGRRGASVAFHVLVDGEPPGVDGGVDVDADGHGKLTEPRCYQLVRQTHDVIERTCEIAFDDPHVEANVFTFG